MKTETEWIDIVRAGEPKEHAFLSAQYAVFGTANVYGVQQDAIESARSEYRAEINKLKDKLRDATLQNLNYITIENHNNIVTERNNRLREAESERDSLKEQVEELTIQYQHASERCGVAQAELERMMDEIRKHEIRYISSGGMEGDRILWYSTIDALPGSKPDEPEKPNIDEMTAAKITVKLADLALRVTALETKSSLIGGQNG